MSGRLATNFCHKGKKHGSCGSSDGCTGMKEGSGDVVLEEMEKLCTLLFHVEIRGVALVMNPF
jgi:hypothetical protein